MKNLNDDQIKTIAAEIYEAARHLPDCGDIIMADDFLDQFVDEDDLGPEKSALLRAEIEFLHWHCRLDASF